MGTRGLRVHRHRGRYYSVYNHCDSYPEGLGVDFAATIPRDPTKYQAWLASARQEVDEIIEHYTDDPDSVSEEQPANTLFLEWVYEIDLDNEIFHVNMIPFFRLDNMPDGKVFVKSIGKDSYQHNAYKITTPEAHRYNWTALPPIVSQEVISNYHRSAVGQYYIVPIHELLDIPEAQSRVETTRIHLFQTIVGCMMYLHTHGRLFRILESVPNLEEIPTKLLLLGHSIGTLAMQPAIYDHPKYSPRFNPRDGSRKYVTWVSPQTCLLVTTHLDEENNLKAAVVKMTHAVEECYNATAGTIYGVAFSFFHCIIIRFEKGDNGAIRFKHTPALQFLPSFYATSPSTPGIDALMRLACLSDVLVALDVQPILQRLLPKVADLPLETWMQIASDLSTADDLINLAQLSPRSWSAANAILKFPHVGKYRITGVGKVPEKVVLRLWAGVFESVCDHEGRAAVCTLYATGPRPSYFAQFDPSFESEWGNQQYPGGGKPVIEEFARWCPRYRVLESEDDLKGDDDDEGEE